MVIFPMLEEGAGAWEVNRLPKVSPIIMTSAEGAWPLCHA